MFIICCETPFHEVLPDPLAGPYALSPDRVGSLFVFVVTSRTLGSCVSLYGRS